jgi:hypothetical protein
MASKIVIETEKVHRYISRKIREDGNSCIHVFWNFVYLSRSLSLPIFDIALHEYGTNHT